VGGDDGCGGDGCIERGLGFDIMTRGRRGDCLDGEHRVGRGATCGIPERIARWMSKTCSFYTLQVFCHPGAKKERMSERSRHRGAWASYIIMDTCDVLAV
jgi:hypothetical protein